MKTAGIRLLPLITLGAGGGMFETAAQQGHNANTIAICMGGLKKENFTVEQKRALVALCLYLEQLIKGLTFHGHCEVNPEKTCPVYPYKEWLQLSDRGVMRLI